MASASHCLTLREDDMAELGEILAQQRREWVEDHMVKIIARFGRLEPSAQNKIYAIRVKLFNNEAITEEDVKVIKGIEL